MDVLLRGKVKELMRIFNNKVTMMNSKEVRHGRGDRTSLQGLAFERHWHCAAMVCTGLARVRI